MYFFKTIQNVTLETQVCGVCCGSPAKMNKRMSKTHVYIWKTSSDKNEIWRYNMAFMLWKMSTKASCKKLYYYIYSMLKPCVLCWIRHQVCYSEIWSYEKWQSTPNHFHAQDHCTWEINKSDIYCFNASTFVTIWVTACFSSSNVWAFSRHVFLLPVSFIFILLVS